MWGTNIGEACGMTSPQEPGRVQKQAPGKARDKTPSHNLHHQSRLLNTLVRVSHSLPPHKSSRSPLCKAIGDMMRPGRDRERRRCPSGSWQRRGVRNEETRVPVYFAVVVDNAAIRRWAQTRATPRVNSHGFLDHPG